MHHYVQEKTCENTILDKICYFEVLEYGQGHKNQLNSFSPPNKVSLQVLPKYIIGSVENECRKTEELQTQTPKRPHQNPTRSSHPIKLLEVTLS